MAKRVEAVPVKLPANVPRRLRDSGVQHGCFLRAGDIEIPIFHGRLRRHGIVGTITVRKQLTVVIVFMVISWIFGVGSLRSGSRISLPHSYRHGPCAKPDIAVVEVTRPAGFAVRDFDISPAGSELVFDRVQVSSELALIERTR